MCECRPYVHPDKRGTVGNRIVAAAQLLDGWLYTLPAPARHHHIIGHVIDVHRKASLHAEQGFLLDDGRFARRNAAEFVARQNGQITGRLMGSVLTSEDLW